MAGMTSELYPGSSYRRKWGKFSQFPLIHHLYVMSSSASNSKVDVQALNQNTSYKMISCEGEIRGV